MFDSRSQGDGSAAKLCLCMAVTVALMLIMFLLEISGILLALAHRHPCWVNATVSFVEGVQTPGDVAWKGVSDTLSMLHHFPVGLAAATFDLRAD